MLNENEISILLQIIDGTNFSGKDVTAIHELKMKLYSIKNKSEKIEKIEKNPS